MSKSLTLSIRRKGFPRIAITRGGKQLKKADAEAINVVETQAIYDSEINFNISTFFDGGYSWKLGDEMNGFRAQGSEKTLIDAVRMLDAAVRKHFPDSEYAKLRSKTGNEIELREDEVLGLSVRTAARKRPRL